MVSPNSNSVYHLPDNMVKDFSPINIVLRHKVVEQIFLSREHTTEHRAGIVRETVDVEKWHKQENVKYLEIR